MAAAAALVALLAGVGMFLTIGAAPCDPTAPVLSDGTRQAPAEWAAGWWMLMGACGVAFGVAVGLTIGLRWPARRWKRSGVIAASAALFVLWLSGATYWASQCPA